MKLQIISILGLIAIIIFQILEIIIEEVNINSSFLLILLLLFLIISIWQSIHLQKLLSFLNQYNHHQIEKKVPNALINNGYWDEIFFYLAKLIRKFQNSKVQLEKSHSDFITAIQALPIGLLMLDSQKKIVWLNRIAAIHLDLDENQDFGNFITHLVRYPDFIKFLNDDISGSSEDNFDKDTLMIEHDGVHGLYAISVRQINYDKGKIIITQDVSDSVRIEKMRRHFIANISHELKTPLAIIKSGFDNLLKLPLNKQETKQSSEIIEDQLKKMTSLIRDLLILAKLEGETKPNIDNIVNLENIVSSLKNTIANLSGGKHQINYQLDMDIEIKGNEDEILSAFVNITNNAIYYTPTDKSINIELFCKNNEKVFRVIDEGVGVDPIHINRLTERFYRVDETRNLNPNGTGLGLSIVRHVLLRHNGIIEINSQEGKGTVVELKFSD